MKSKRKPRPKKVAPVFGAVWRVLACFALVLVAVVLAGVVAVRVLVTPETLKTRIVEQLQKTFRRPVRIDHVTILLHQGIKVSGLEIEESEEFPGDRLLSSELLVASYKLSGLLRGRLELDQVLLVAPRIHLRRLKDGRWNVEDAWKRPEKTAAEPRRFALPPLHSAKVLTVERGLVRVEDRLKDYSVKLDGVNLSVRNFSMDMPFSANVSFRGEGEARKKKLKADVGFFGTISLGGLRPEAIKVSAKRLRIETAGRRAEISGTAGNLRRPEADLDVRLPRLDSEWLSRFHKVPEGIRAPASRWTIKAQGPEVLPAAVEGSTATAGPLAAREYRIKKLIGRAGPLSLAVSGRIDSKTGWGRLWVSAPKFPLKNAAELYKGWSQRGVGGRAEGSATLKGHLRSPTVERLSLNLTDFSYTTKKGRRISQADIRVAARDEFASMSVSVGKGAFVAYGNALSDLDLDFSLKKGDLIFRKFDLTWNESRIKLRGCFRDVARLGKVYLDGEVNRLRLDETYSAIENLIDQRKAEKGIKTEEGRGWSEVFKHAIPNKFPDLAGQLRVSDLHTPNFSSQNVTIDSDLRNISKGLGDAAGAFQIGFGPGRVNNVPEVRKSHALVNVFLLPFSFMQEMEAKARGSFATAELQTLDINRTSGNFSVENGVVGVRYVHFDGPQFVAYLDGRMSFPTERVDMHVLLRATTARGQLPFRLQDSKGRPALDLMILKDLNKPEAALTHRKMKDNEVEEALDAGRKRAADVGHIDDVLACGRDE